MLAAHQYGWPGPVLAAERQQAMHTLAKKHHPGFDEDMFVLALRAIRRLPVAEFIPYGIENTEAPQSSNEP